MRRCACEEGVLVVICRLWWLGGWSCMGVWLTRELTGLIHSVEDTGELVEE